MSVNLCKPQAQQQQQKHISQEKILQEHISQQGQHHNRLQRKQQQQHNRLQLKQQQQQQHSDNQITHNLPQTLKQLVCVSNPLKKILE